jgi:hypothetical protein
LIDFPTNISGGFNTKTSVVRNLTLVYGRRNVTGERPIGVVVGSTACPVDFIGTYQTDNVAPKGLINCTDPMVNTGSHEGLCARLNGSTVSFEGIRFRGEAPLGWNGSANVPRRMVTSELTPVITLTNCVIDPGFNGTVDHTESGTLTNAEFDALHPGLP